MTDRRRQCVKCGEYLADQVGTGVVVCESCRRSADGGGEAEAIRFAILSDDVKTVERFLIQRSEYRPWVMHEAASGGRPCVAAYLMDTGNGLDLDAALVDAVLVKDSISQHLGHVRVAEMLLRRGADVNVRGGWRYETPLLAAARSGNRQMVELLRNFMEELDLFAAAALGEVGVAERCLAGQPYLGRAIDQSGAMAMHYCAASGLGRGDQEMSDDLVALAELLCEYGGEVDAEEEPVAVPRYPVGMRPLHFAAEGNPAMAAWLLGQGVAVDAFDRWRRTPLQIALAHSFEIAEMLVDWGAEVDAPNGEDGRTALHAMVDDGCEAAVVWLLGKGANVNLAGLDGKTPLHDAAQRGVGAALVRLLVEAGAEVNGVDGQGRTALDYAAEGPEAAILREYGAVGSVGAVSR